MGPEPLSPASSGDIAGLAQEIVRIAEKLARLTSPADEPVESRQTAAGQARSVRAYLKARRQRGRLLPAELFAEPAWDLLLDLYAARIEGTAVSVSSACIAAAVPPTTALRWLGKLQELGLVVRDDDIDDARRTYLRLTAEACAAIGRWLMLSPLHPESDLSCFSQDA